MHPVLSLLRKKSKYKKYVNTKQFKIVFDKVTIHCDKLDQKFVI